MTMLTQRPASPPILEAGSTPWASGPCRALEHTFEVVVKDGWDIRALLPVLAPFTIRGRDSAPTSPSFRYEIRSGERAGQVSLYAEGECISSGRYTNELLGSLAWHINQSVIRTSVHRYLLMHAAAATTADVTVVLAADMESGKTTTVAGLLRSGFDYVTDEAVAVDPGSLRVSPFPKTLSVDPGSWPLFPECAPVESARVTRQWLVEPARLGARIARDPVPAPSVILFPKYVAGAKTELLPVSPGEATHEMCRMSFEFADHPRRNLLTAARLATSATCARLRIGSLDEALNLIHELVSHRILEAL